MRRLALTVATLLVATTTPVTAAGQEAVNMEAGITTFQRATNGAVTLFAPATVAPRSTVRLTGTAKARKRTPVVIQQRRIGRKSWTEEGTTRVRRKGRFSYTETVTNFDRQYRACVRGRCSKPVAVRIVRPEPPAPQPTSLTLTGGPSAQIEAGQTITATGTASGNLIGKSVAFQVYDTTSETWGAIGGAVVDGSGNWAVSGPIGTAGKIAVRIVAPATPTTLASSVGAGVISVFGWYYLSDMGTVEGEWDGSGAYRISGATYTNSVAEDTEYIQVDLARSCIRFSTVVGLNDSSASGSRAAVRLLADSVERYANNNLTLGVGFPVTFDLTNALRLVVEPTNVTSGPEVVLGDAKILCSF
ncbi:NPCBM/NEW2 domain-containing protein [Nocardioides terrigena]|uniref:NPCBM/NEW2 domain-containing protein n=1 Tax=Nocardioides terrigena TaxID=424797 RepID=UPI000D30B7ED|nr:NPCBM/NEW2 domain-containing protein [Nocardioides terrigena]